MGMANGSITARVSKAQVKPGQSVTFTGRAKGVKVGTKVVLLHMHNGKWTPLKSSTVLKNGSSYSLVTKFNNKGKEQLRVMAGKVVSPTVVVTVK
jgi:predicted methyltransferase